jgi:hypothetical protein
MELKTIYSTTNLSNGRIQDNTTFISGIKCNNLDIITDKVKIKSKRGQSAMNIRENLEDKFLKIAQIERKKTKKQNFFNKHKK